MIFSLIIFLGLLLLIDFLIFQKDLTSPSIIFTSGFFISALIYGLVAAKWRTDISSNTFWVVCGSNLFLSVGVLLANQIKPKKYYSFNQFVFLPIPTSRLVILFFLYILSGIYRLYFLLKNYGAGSIAGSLYQYTMMMKSGEDMEKYPLGVGFFFSIIDLSSYIVPFLLAMYLTIGTKYKRQKFWLGINFVLSSVFSLLSSGRTFLLLYISIFIFAYLMCLRFKGKPFPIKTILKIILCGYIFLFSFMNLGFLIGREDHGATAFDTFVGYTGAQYQNLDDLITGETPQPITTHFGERTFYLFYKTFESYGLTKLNNKYFEFLPFNSIHGYDTGNVATALQSYYLDFGLLGCFIVCVIIGFIAQFIYMRANVPKVYETGVLSSWTILFCFISSRLFMSFFSEQFFDICNSLLSIKTIIKIYIILWFLYGRHRSTMYEVPQVRA